MLYWWPKVKDLDSPVPETKIVEIPYRSLAVLLEGHPLEEKYLAEAIERSRWNLVSYRYGRGREVLASSSSR